MSQGRIEIEQEPGVFVYGARARWLLQARRARLTPEGKLRILHGCAHARPGMAPGPAADSGPRVEWSAYSSVGVPNRSGTRWLRGFHMNGDAVNHA